MGPVVDVRFEEGELPHIKDALTVENSGKTCVMEVAQHMGNRTVRCIMLSASEGLARDMEVAATGDGISVPVGDKTLGRLFNVLGETIDGGRLPPLRIKARWWKSWRRELRLLTCWPPTPREERSDSSEAPEWARPC